jgi:hypothetical protein
MLGRTMRLPGSHKVTLIKGLGTESASRQVVVAAIQPKKGFLEVTTPVMVGDVIEDKDPRAGAGVLQYSVAGVEIYQGHGTLDHIEVTWGEAPHPGASQPKVLTIGRLDSRIAEVAGGLYADGHPSQAVFDAMKAVEVRVREMSGIDDVGKRLIGRVFGGATRCFA